MSGAARSRLSSISIATRNSPGVRPGLRQDARTIRWKEAPRRWRVCVRRDPETPPAPPSPARHRHVSVFRGGCSAATDRRRRACAGRAPHRARQTSPAERTRWPLLSSAAVRQPCSPTPACSAVEHQTAEPGMQRHARHFRGRFAARAQAIQQRFGSLERGDGRRSEPLQIQGS